MFVNNIKKIHFSINKNQVRIVPKKIQVRIHGIYYFQLERKRKDKLSENEN
jgi:hypothetical protein